MMALLLILFALRRLNVIRILWLEASTVDELDAIGPVCLVGMPCFAKNRLDVMISLIARPLNPDSFRLIYCWYNHDSPPE
jgi:hypothetical protein